MPTMDELRHLQAQPLERKVRLTQTRIMEYYQKLDGKVYVSFSGGKDSTVLLDLARRCYPEIEAVFANTGLEYPEIVSFVKSVENVTILKPKMTFREVLEKYGYPVISKDVAETIAGARRGGNDTFRQKKISGRLLLKNGEISPYNCQNYEFLMDAPFLISSRCCDVMKKQPFKRYEKQSGKHPIVGTMADESMMRKSAWLANGCNSFKGRTRSAPMSFWNKQDVLQYLKRTEIPYCKIYGEIAPKGCVGQISMEGVETSLMTTGLDGTGCMFCMFGVHLEKEPNRFQRMKLTHPKLYDYCIREENGLGIGKVLDYIGVKY